MPVLSCINRTTLEANEWSEPKFRQTNQGFASARERWASVRRSLEDCSAATGGLFELVELLSSFPGSIWQLGDLDSPQTRLSL